MVSYLKHETHNLQNGLLSSFQRPIPSRIFRGQGGNPGSTGCFLSGLDEVRRGSVLIRGTGRTVNADRRFFRDPLACLSNLEILKRFSELENSGRRLVPTV
jgi:hypothetical protein